MDSHCLKSVGVGPVTRLGSWKRLDCHVVLLSAMYVYVCVCAESIHVVKQFYLGPRCVCVGGWGWGGGWVGVFLLRVTKKISKKRTC
jgi:hypothetical protein